MKIHRRERRFTLLGRALDWQPIEALDFEFQVQDRSPKKPHPSGSKRSHSYQGHKVAIGVFYSAKSGLTFRYDSGLERSWFSILENDPAVRRFFRTPFAIPYIFDGKCHLYRPDLLVEYVNGSQVLVEIKHPLTIEEPRNKTKHEAAAEWCLARGIPFQVWTFPSQGPFAF